MVLKQREMTQAGDWVALFICTLPEAKLNWTPHVQLRAVLPAWLAYKLWCVSVLPSDTSTSCSCPDTGVKCKEFLCAGSVFLGSCCTKNLSALLTVLCSPRTQPRAGRASLCTPSPLDPQPKLSEILPSSWKPHWKPLEAMETVVEVMVWEKLTSGQSLAFPFSSLCLRRRSDLVQSPESLWLPFPPRWQLNSVFQECTVHSLNFCEPWQYECTELCFALFYSICPLSH